MKHFLILPALTLAACSFPGAPDTNRLGSIMHPSQDYCASRELTLDATTKQCVTSAVDGGARDDASDGSDRDDASDASVGAIGNGISAASRSSRTFAASSTGSVTRTGTASVAKYTGSATSTGATASAGAPGRPIGADRARCADSPRTRPRLRPHVRARPFCQSQRLSVRQHQRPAAASACSRVQISVQSLQLQICDR